MLKDIDLTIDAYCNTVPKEIVNSINYCNIDLTPYDEKNTLLDNEKLQYQAGYKKFQDGSYLVAMYCPMPNITAEMIEWWFWWHPQKSERYRIWFPKAHTSVSYNKKDRTYFESPRYPGFQPNTQYPTEKIGGVRLPLRIDFISPSNFGFSKETMCEYNIPLIVCGHVGVFDGLIWHTEMAHIFKQTNDGLFMFSRFWLGNTLKNSLFRKFMLTDKTAKSMAEHCCIEYRNLCGILPKLYDKFAK